MCQLITPCYPCGHQDDPWLLYCKPTRKICGRKHPPLERCHGTDIGKRQWNVWEPRCSKCEKRHGRRKSSAVSDHSSSSAGSPRLGRGLLSRRRRTGSLLDGFKDIFRPSSGDLPDIKDVPTPASEELPDGSDKDTTGYNSDVDDLQMLELRNTLSSLAIVDTYRPRRGGMSGSTGSVSSYDSMPCSPRTTVPPTPEEYFPIS